MALIRIGFHFSLIIANQQNKSAKAFLKESITSFEPYPITYGVVSSAYLVKSMLLKMENRAHIKMLSKSSPRMVPWGKSKRIFSQQL